MSRTGLALNALAITASWNAPRKIVFDWRAIVGDTCPDRRGDPVHADGPWLTPGTPS
jgi:hypothetical protein